MKTCSVTCCCHAWFFYITASDVWFSAAIVARFGCSRFCSFSEPGCVFLCTEFPAQKEIVFRWSSSHMQSIRCSHTRQVKFQPRFPAVSVNAKTNGSFFSTSSVLTCNRISGWTLEQDLLPCQQFTCPVSLLTCTLLTLLCSCTLCRLLYRYQNSYSLRQDRFTTFNKQSEWNLRPELQYSLVLLYRVIKH